MYSLLKNCRVTRIKNAAVAGSTALTSDTVDMEGYDGVMFIALLGTLTASQITSIKCRQGAVAAMSDAADLEGTLTGPMADGDSNKMLVLDVYRPRERYVNCIINRATANAVVDGLLCIQYAGNPSPATQPASVSASKQVVSPPEGTA